MRTFRLDYLPPGQVCTHAHWQYSRHDPSPPLHDHTYPELFWTTAGSGLHVINGETRPLTAGLLVLVRPEDAHGFSGPIDGGEPLCLVNFSFHRTLWTALRRRHPALSGAWFDERDHRKREYRLHPDQPERLRQLSADLVRGACDALAAEALLTGIIALLTHAARSERQGSLPDWLARACERLREPRHFIGGTAAFARLACCSPAHLAREVRRRLQCTPTDLVNAARLTHAAQQLATTTTPILDIAIECGFENLGHFYKLFRSHHGATPLSYRRHAMLPVLTNEGSGAKPAKKTRR
ncbi:MAG TPA: AraC family transcriptional regulator [Chthoniobacterales bacterium]|jgi:AraC family cel operon transcriptional repressor